MLRKVVVVVVIMMLAIAGLSCRKKTSESATKKTEVKSQAEYEAQAKKEIDSNNMKAELDKIEEQLQQERGG